MFDKIEYFCPPTISCFLNWYPRHRSQMEEAHGQQTVFRMVMNYSQASCLFFTFITKERNCCALSWIRARSFLLSSAEGRTLISWRNLSASLPINMGVFLIGLAIITRLNSNYAAKLLIYFQFTKQFPTFLRKSIINHHQVVFSCPCCRLSPSALRTNFL